MGIYISLIFLPFIASVFFLFSYSPSTREYKKIFCYIIFCVLLFVSGFRATTVGGDLEEYLPEFAYISNMGFSEIVHNGYVNREMGYALLEKVISCVSNSNTFYLFSISFVFLYIIFWGIYKYSINILLSTYLFLFCIYPNSLNILRASISIAICIYAYQYIVSRRLFRFCLMILVAYYIHRTSIAFFPAYFLYGKKIHLKLIVFVLIFSLGCSFVISGSSISDLIKLYFTIYNSSDDVINEYSSGISNLSYLQIALLSFSLYLYKINKISDELYSFFVYLLVVATVIQFFSPIYVLINRISSFYYSYVIFFIPYMISFVKKKNRLIVIMMTYFVFLSYYLVGLYKDVQSIVPYSFVF